MPPVTSITMSNVEGGLFLCILAGEWPTSSCQISTMIQPTRRLKSQASHDLGPNPVCDEIKEQLPWGAVRSCHCICSVDSALELKDYTKGWQHLECEIATGCTIYPVLFVTAFKIILWSQIRSIKLPSDELPPLTSPMHGEAPQAHWWADHMSKKEDKGKKSLNKKISPTRQHNLLKARQRLI